MLSTQGPTCGSVFEQGFLIFRQNCLGNKKHSDRKTLRRVNRAHLDPFASVRLWAKLNHNCAAGAVFAHLHYGEVAFSKNVCKGFVRDTALFLNQGGRRVNWYAECTWFWENVKFFGQTVSF
jgi:hypothetical protein